MIRPKYKELFRRSEKRRVDLESKLIVTERELRRLHGLLAPQGDRIIRLHQGELEFRRPLLLCPFEYECVRIFLSLNSTPPTPLVEWGYTVLSWRGTPIEKVGQ